MCNFQVLMTENRQNEIIFMLQVSIACNWRKVGLYMHFFKSFENTIQIFGKDFCITGVLRFKTAKE